VNHALYRLIQASPPIVITRLVRVIHATGEAPDGAGLPGPGCALAKLRLRQGE